MLLICSCSCNIERVDSQKYFEMIACLLMTEENNELLPKNHKFHLIGSKAFSEVNNIHSHRHGYRNGQSQGIGQGYGMGPIVAV